MSGEDKEALDIIEGLMEAACLALPYLESLGFCAAMQMAVDQWRANQSPFSDRPAGA